MNFEAVIIGASSAGLIAAEKLAQAGLKIGVFEQGSALPSEKRTYIITQGIFRVVPDLDPGLIRNRILSIAVEAGGQSASIRLASPDLVIERSELIESLYQRALSAGAEIRFNSHFLQVGKAGIEIEVDGQMEVFQARVLIGADGVKSKVRAQTNPERIPVLPLLQAETDLPEGWDPGETRVWFDPERTSYFYWLIPDSGGKGVLGLIADPGANIRGLLDRFAGGQGLDLADYQAGSAAYYSRSLRNEYQVNGVRILFAGDAAGQVKVTTVGGTVTGLMGGIAAANAALRGASFSSELKRVERELNLHLFIRELLAKMKGEDYQRLIRSLNPAVLGMLSRHDRDRMRSHFWKLPFLQPDFIPLGTRLLLRLLFSGKR